MKQLIDYTKEPPACPKCGSSEVRRIHCYRRDESYPSKFSYSGAGDYEDTFSEFLKLCCQRCHYSWGQKVKEEDNA